MTWVRLDDQFADHPKVEAAGPLAGWLFVCGLCYCAEHLTDGFIPESRAPRLAAIPQPARHVTALVDVGLWEEVAGGYRVHDYHDYQPSAERVRAEREAAKERVRKSRQGSGERAAQHAENAERTSAARATPPFPFPNVPSEHQPPPTPPTSSDGPAAGGGVLEQACRIYASRLADERSDLTSRPGWIAARTRSLVNEHADEAHRVLAVDPDLSAERLARYLAGEHNVVDLPAWKPCNEGDCDEGWIVHEDGAGGTALEPCPCRDRRWA